MSDKSPICVLVSGGLDSDVLLAEFALKYKKVWPLYIRQGLVWEKVELYWLAKFINELHRTPHPNPLPQGERGRKKESPRPFWGRGSKGEGIQPLVVFSLPMSDVYGAHWSTGGKPAPGARSVDSAVYLPGRNMILSVKAAVFAAMRRIPILAIGSLDHNPFPDAAPAFYRRWGDVLGSGLGRRLKVIAPYRHLSKAEVIVRGRRLPLELSFSCIAPRGKSHCGRCNKCAERRRAFKAAGVKDQTIYASD